MRYGYFDDEAKEYVITRPDTPASWSNYLGSTEYGAIITNNAGGYGFYKSGARGRFLRLRFNAVPMDQPGRYFYLRDEKSGDFWSSSWQPVGKPLSEYESTCRHGTAYTAIDSRYKGIKTESLYYVPLGKKFEYWRLAVTNEGKEARELSVSTFCEFTNQWHTVQDQVNLQYSLFITRGSFEDGILRVAIHDNPALEDADPGHVGMRSWMCLTGAPVTGYDTSREAFIGTYGGYHAPRAIVEGKPGNSDVYGDNGCGSIRCSLSLKPGERKEIIVLLGIGEGRTEGRRAMAEYANPARADAELAALKKHWHERLGSLIVQTPDEELNHTVNVWGLYNCLITYAWSRAASLVYNGERDGLGFRDSVQDILGVAAAIPAEARARLALLLTGQHSHGGAMPVVQPFDHKPGKEPLTPEEELRSDDCLWFFNAVPAYVAETGDEAFYDEVLPYADSGKATVLGHLRRALEFNLERRGAHGIPCGLSADWNDCLHLGYSGESLFVAFQLRYGLTVYEGLAAARKMDADAAWARAKRDEIDAAIQKHCWDQDRFIWAITDKGEAYGKKGMEEGACYLNTQVWAVISGAATPEQAKTCMETVKRELATPYGLMLSAPAFVKTSIDVMRAVVFNPGIKENAGIFNHTQGWGIMAEALLGNGDRAYEYLRAAMPAAYNDRAEIRQAEPYVQTQTTYSTFSPRAGNTRTSWITGAAAWFYHASTQYVLGIRPEAGGLAIDPCIPSGWKGFKAERRYRGKRVRIEVRNPKGLCRGVKSLLIDGKRVEGCVAAAAALKDGSEIVATLGE
jgi:cellobiose phosphorylase